MTERNQPSLLIAALAGCAGAALVGVQVVLGTGPAVGALLVAAGLLLPVRLPWGGSVPMGAAAIAATVALGSVADAAATLAVALVLTALVLVCHAPLADARTTIHRFGACAAGAMLAALSVRGLVDGEPAVLVGALTASAGLTAADISFARFAGATGRFDPHAALPAHLTLACAGALIAVAVSEVGIAMAAVAAFPMLITRFSFERYAGATDTFDQTVQALGLVPELAGLAPLGHSERSAHYAHAIAGAVGLDRAQTARVVTATRLHHLGSVPHETGVDTDTKVAPGDVAETGARILREAKFPGDIADLLASANAGAVDATAPTLEAAVVRTAAIFDELVGEEADGADQALAMVTASARDPHSRRAAAALLELVAADAALVSTAVAAGDRFRDAADLDLHTVTTGRGELLQFVRRG